MTEKKDTIFFAHSFEDKPPEWSERSDLEVAKWFEDRLKKKWRVLSGKRTEARAILDKITDAVDQSQAVFALFTRRYSTDGGNEHYSPSPWVISECAYALGRSRDPKYPIVGFREKGVDPEALALLGISGTEFPEFDRNNLDDSTKSFQTYMSSLETTIRYGDSMQPSLLMDSPYLQVDLKKIFLIYRNGFGTVQNITNVTIKDPERFLSENQGRIRHRIWAPNRDLPLLDQMQKVSVDKRKQEAYFHAKLDKYPNRYENPRLEVCDVTNSDDRIVFYLKFLDSAGHRLRFKKRDSISYQYAWGIPNMFATADNDLGDDDENLISAINYNLAELDANHGMIENVDIELRFERETSYVHEHGLFSKSPFYRISHGYSDPDWTQPRAIDLLKGAAGEYDMWYEIYALHLNKFDGKLQIAWRPSSRK